MTDNKHLATVLHLDYQAVLESPLPDLGNPEVQQKASGMFAMLAE